MLNTLAGDVFRPAVIDAVLDGVLEAMSPRAIASEVHELRTELQAVERELDRLTVAIAAGGPLTPLLEALKTRRARRDELLTAIAARDAVDVGRFDRKTIEAKARQHMKAWRALLTKHVQDARQLLREVLTGPLRFTPEGRTYRSRSFGGFTSCALALADPPRRV